MKCSAGERREERDRMPIKRRDNAVASLCWDCKNAVPQGGHGCSWSERFEPVPGWGAERRDIRTGPKKEGTTESYFVYRCPEFERDGAND